MTFPPFLVSPDPSPLQVRDLFCLHNTKKTFRGGREWLKKSLFWCLKSPPFFPEELGMMLAKNGRKRLEVVELNGKHEFGIYNYRFSIVKCHLKVKE